MHRSSSMTFIYKYLFVPVWGGGFLFGILATWNLDDSFSRDWSRGAALMVGFGLIWLTIMMVRLRRVEANDSNIVIKTLFGKRTLEYKNIEWIYQLAMISPALISLKYLDSETGEHKKILIMPSTSSQMFRFNISKDLEMTEYIRDQIKLANPNYSEELEPSKWLPVGLIFLTALPVILIINLYFSNF